MLIAVYERSTRGWVAVPSRLLDRWLPSGRLRGPVQVNERYGDLSPTIRHAASQTPELQLFARLTSRGKSANIIRTFQVRWPRKKLICGLNGEEPCPTLTYALSQLTFSHSCPLLACCSVA